MNKQAIGKLVLSLLIYNAFTLAIWLTASAKVTADAGKDQTVSSTTERVQLHGKASHSFAWTEIIGPPAVIFGDHQLNPWVQLSIDGEYWFMLVVSDGQTIATSTVHIRKGKQA